MAYNKSIQTFDLSPLTAEESRVQPSKSALSTVFIAIESNKVDTISLNDASYGLTGKSHSDRQDENYGKNYWN